MQSTAFYRCRKFCTISRKPGSGRPSKITNYVRQIVEMRMQYDDEITAYELLVSNGINISLRTVV